MVSGTSPWKDEPIVHNLLETWTLKHNRPEPSKAMQGWNLKTILTCPFDNLDEFLYMSTDFMSIFDSRNAP